MSGVKIVIFLLSLISIVLEGVMFWKIRKNGVRIFKYYTLLSNFVFLITSVVVVIFGLIGNEFPLWVQGLYLMVTLGLTLTMIVYWVVIHPRERKNKKIASQASGLSGVSDFASNLIWHTICPIFAIVCLLIFPNVQIGMEWILAVIIPTIVYCAVYAVLTFGRHWDEPYGFLIENRKFSKKGFVLCLIIIAFALMLDFGLYQIMGILA